MLETFKHGWALWKAGSNYEHIREQFQPVFAQGYIGSNCTCSVARKLDKKENQLRVKSNS